jgi:peptidoglycan/LPS O-acetylase OafA/YrhL
MKKLFPSLNGLRAISISIVVINHLFMRHIISHSNGYDLFAAISDIINGGFGVTIFFVLSGFLITRLLMIEEAENKSISIKNFYMRRILRIFPAYYFLLLVYAVLQLIGFLHTSNISWLTALTFTKQFNSLDNWHMTHLWSLSVEEFFYLFWPFIFIKSGGNRNKFPIAIICIVVLLRVFLMKFPVSGLDSITIFERADALMIGCLFAINYDWIVRFNKENANTRLSVCVSVLLLFLVIPFLVNYFHIKHVYPLVMTLFGPYGILSNLLVANIMVISINTRNLWNGFLNNAVMNYIGKISYSIYLWQQFFTLGKPTFSFSAPVAILLILICANASYYFIEKPFLRFKSKFE